MKKYVVRTEPTEEERSGLSVYDRVLQDLLYGRGIMEVGDAERFLNPDYDHHIHDPYLLKDMDKTVERILSAFEKNEKIAIFSDYDADGIPGAVVLSDFFKKIGYENFIVYIPHRNNEGYGLNHEALEKISEEGVTLVITIDCGISNHEEVEKANSFGMDVIVTDHHLPKSARPNDFGHSGGDSLPPAYAVVDHKRVDCLYPDKNLCGSGVIWKVITALLKHKTFQERYSVQVGYEKWLLDLVGLATLSDMVPLVGENRVIASYGLKVLRKSPRPGFHKLFELLKVKQSDITEDDVGFLITPRINAASRMGHPKDAYDMLSSTDVTEAGVLAEHLNKINDERKGVVASMVKEIKKTIADREGILRNVIVLGNPEWKPSLLGLVANSFSDEHDRPVFLWGRDSENNTKTLIKGSCRSGGDINIHSLMEHAADIFVEYGGHKQAGGFSLLQDNIHVLEDRLNVAFDEIVNSGAEASVECIDKKLSVNDVDWNIYRHIEKLAPFGVGNPKPLFLFEGAEIFSTKQFGKEKNHLEIVFKNNKGKAIQAIAFFSGPEKFGLIAPGQKINLVAHIEKSTFRNFPELRLRIVDVI